MYFSRFPALDRFAVNRTFYAKCRINVSRCTARLGVGGFSLDGRTGPQHSGDLKFSKIIILFQLFSRQGYRCWRVWGLDP